MPPTVSTAPTRAHGEKDSSNSRTPPTAASGAFEVNSTEVRRGPIRAMAVNSAMSPTRMPTSPDTASSPRSERSMVDQPPLTVARTRSMALT